MAKADVGRQQCPPLLLSSALPLILQHSTISQQQDIICRLLCTSKAMWEAIEGICAGQLPAAFDTDFDARPVIGPWLRTPQQDAASFCAWLGRHGRILKTLEVNMKMFTLFGTHDYAADIAAALQQLVARQDSSFPATPAGPRGLLLQSYSGNICSAEVLEQLPCHTVTRLSVMPTCGAEVLDWTVGRRPNQPHHTTAAENDAATQAGATAGRKALARLTKLQSLSVFGWYAEEWLPAVSAIDSLTQLQCHKMSTASVSQLQHLPGVNLKSLTLSVSPNIFGWQRKRVQPQLGHLTALRELSCTGEGLFAVQAHEVLPQQLTALTVVDCPSAQPLIPLKQLKVLRMTASTTCAAELRNISNELQQLQQVQLTYARDPEVIGAAAVGWVGLPLTALELNVYPGPVTADTVHELAKLWRLTHLSIVGYCVKCEVSASQLAKVIVQLSNLRELKLASLRLLPDERGLQGIDLARQIRVQQRSSVGAAPGLAADAGGTAPHDVVAIETTQVIDNESLAPTAATAHSNTGLWVLMHVIAQLPQLNSFSLSQIPLGHAAAGLAAAMTLTRLKLNECELVDSAVEVLAGSLTSLRRLSLSWNFKLSDSIIRPIAVGLGQLDELIVSSTKVSKVEPLRQKVPPVKVVV